MPVEAPEAPMATKKRGRPESGRNDVTAKIDADVIRKAKVVAGLDGKTIAEYLSEILAPIVDRDLKRKVGRLSEPKDRQ